MKYNQLVWEILFWYIEEKEKFDYFSIMHDIRKQTKILNQLLYELE